MSEETMPIDDDRDSSCANNGDSVAVNIRQLRDAIRRNLVIFPSNTPTFSKISRPEIHWRMALLYFVRGWSCTDIGRRYGFSKQRAHQLIAQWAKRALTLEYIVRVHSAEGVHFEFSSVQR